MPHLLLRNSEEPTHFNIPCDMTAFLSANRDLCFSIFKLVTALIIGIHILWVIIREPKY